MPQLGESIAEATIVNLLVAENGSVEADQDIIEVETNKATMNVSSPASGRVEKITAKLNESYPVGAVLGQLEVSVEEAERVRSGRTPALALTGVTLVVAVVVAVIAAVALIAYFVS